jgi:hypothetical protein
MDTLNGEINATHWSSSLAFREKEPTAVMASKNRKKENPFRSM